MEISFRFEVTGSFQSEELWKDLEPLKVNLLDTIEHVYVYGTVIPSILMYIIMTCSAYGSIRGGEFTCE